MLAGFVSGSSQSFMRVQSRGRGARTAFFCGFSSLLVADVAAAAADGAVSSIYGDDSEAAVAADGASSTGGNGASSSLMFGAGVFSSCA